MVAVSYTQPSTYTSELTQTHTPFTALITQILIVFEKGGTLKAPLCEILYHLVVRKRIAAI